MLQLLGRRASDRKLRLFAVACVRGIWHLLSEEASRTFQKKAEQFAVSLTVSGDVFAASRKFVEVVERYGEGLVNDDELMDAYGAACEVAWNANDYIGTDALETWVACVAAKTAYIDVHHIDSPGHPISAIDQFDIHLRIMEALAKVPGGTSEAESIAQAALLRCIFGMVPFRAVPIVHSSSTVTAVAQTIYDDRAFDRLPILADALEDAGCTNQDILAHCRRGDEHVRGCWVVDLLLGKE
jgi:hypothetical protein